MVLAGFRAVAFVPAELGLAAHPGAGRNGHRAGLEIADHRAGRQEIDARGFLDIAFQFARDRDLVGANTAAQLGACLDGEIAVDIDIALETAGDAYAAAAFDLALDREVVGDQRFLPGAGTAAAGGTARLGASSSFDGASWRTDSISSGAEAGVCRGAVLSFQRAMTLSLG